MLIYGFYWVMLEEIELLLSSGRIKDARSRYAAFKKQFRKGVNSLEAYRWDMNTIPLPAREMVWYCVRAFVNDPEHLFAADETGDLRIPARIEAIAARLHLRADSELEFFRKTTLPLRTILACIDLEPMAAAQRH